MWVGGGSGLATVALLEDAWPLLPPEPPPCDEPLELLDPLDAADRDRDREQADHGQRDRHDRSAQPRGRAEPARRAALIWAPTRSGLAHGA